jgi:hypothetical protein
VVRIKVRRQGGGFESYEHVLKVLLHELCHNEHGPHSASFYKLLDDITTARINLAYLTLWLLTPWLRSVRRCWRRGRAAPARALTQKGSAWATAAAGAWRRPTRATPPSRRR